jgi:hypothetical protein
LDNFHRGDCAVDGCPGGGFWSRCGSSSACPGHDFGRNELCLPPKIVELTIVELKIIELQSAELMKPLLSPKRPAFAMRKFSHGLLSGTLEHLSARRQDTFG